jgi:hypothetical protein
VKCNDLVLLPYKLNQLLNDQRRLKRMRATTRSLGRPDAAQVVVEKLLGGEVAPIRLTARKRAKIAQVAAGAQV